MAGYPNLISIPPQRVNLTCEYCYMPATAIAHCDSTSSFIPAPHVSNILKVEPKKLYSRFILEEDPNGL